MKTYFIKRNKMSNKDISSVTAYVIKEDGTKHILPHYILHSHTGFEYGYNGSGPSDLARCILIDVFQKEQIEGVFYLRFRDEIISSWKEDEITITEEEIRVWIKLRFSI